MFIQSASTDIQPSRHAPGTTSGREASGATPDLGHPESLPDHLRDSPTHMSWPRDPRHR